MSCCSTTIFQNSLGIYCASCHRIRFAVLPEFFIDWFFVPRPRHYLVDLTAFVCLTRLKGKSSVSRLVVSFLTMALLTCTLSLGSLFERHIYNRYIPLRMSFVFVWVFISFGGICLTCTTCLDFCVLDLSLLLLLPASE